MKITSYLADWVKTKKVVHIKHISVWRHPYAFEQHALSLFLKLLSQLFFQKLKIKSTFRWFLVTVGKMTNTNFSHMGVTRYFPVFLTYNPTNYLQHICTIHLLHSHSSVWIYGSDYFNKKLKWRKIVCTHCLQFSLQLLQIFCISLRPMVNDSMKYLCSAEDQFSCDDK